jgi:hypothetical protein
MTGLYTQWGRQDAALIKMVIKLRSQIKSLIGLINLANKGLENLFTKFQANAKLCLNPEMTDIFLLVQNLKETIYS